MVYTLEAKHFAVIAVELKKGGSRDQVVERVCNRKEASISRGKAVELIQAHFPKNAFTNKPHSEHPRIINELFRLAVKRSIKEELTETPEDYLKRFNPVSPQFASLSKEPVPSEKTSSHSEYELPAMTEEKQAVLQTLNTHLQLPLRIATGLTLTDYGVEGRNLVFTLTVSKKERLHQLLASHPEYRTRNEVHTHKDTQTKISFVGRTGVVIRVPEEWYNKDFWKEITGQAINRLNRKKGEK